MNVTVSRVADALVAHGYRRRPDVVRIADDGYRFDAVLEGPHDVQGAVLVADGREQAVRLRRRVQALLMSLEAAGSTRPVTLVLVGEAQDEELDRLCRVLRLGGDLSDEALDLSLASLLPLPPLPTRATAASVTDVLAARLGALADDPDVRALLAAAAEGAPGVEATFVRLLERALVDEREEPD